MPLIRQERNGGNWYIRQLVCQKLEDHDSLGDLGPSPRVYLGDSHKLLPIVNLFEISALETDVFLAKIKIRFSCTDDKSKKYHIISLYQSERYSNGTGKQVLQATWIPKKRTIFPTLVEEINYAFEPLVTRMPAYRNKLPEIVSSLSQK